MNVNLMALALAFLGGGVLVHLWKTGTDAAAKAAWAEEQKLIARVHNPLVVKVTAYFATQVLKILVAEEPALVTAFARLHVPAAYTQAAIGSIEDMAPAEYRGPLTGSGDTAPIFPPVVPNAINVKGENGSPGVLPIQTG